MKKNIANENHGGVEYLNHITLTTGHERKTYPDEIIPEMRQELDRIFKEAQSLPDGVEIMDGVTLKITAEKTRYMATVFHTLQNGKRIPVLSTAGSLTDDKELIDRMYNSSPTPLIRSRDSIKAPFIIDRIDLEATTLYLKFKEIFQITGDLCRCLGWYMLAPEQMGIVHNDCGSDSDEAAKPVDIAEFRVGSKYPGAVSCVEGCRFDMTDSGGLLVLGLRHPTAKEIESIRMGDIKVALTVIDGCTFVLAKLGDMAWFDMPYDARLSLSLTKLEQPESTQGYGVTLVLVDTASNEVKALRMFALPNRLSMALKENIETQRREPMTTPAANNARVDAIYRRYSTKDLLKFASVQQRCGAQ